MPVTCGVAIDVPLKLLYKELVYIDRMSIPGATKSISPTGENELMLIIPNKSLNVS